MMVVVSFQTLFVGLDRVRHGLNVGDDVAYIDIGKPEIRHPNGWELFS
jgi:hypothetical protein